MEAHISTLQFKELVETMRGIEKEINAGVEVMKSIEMTLFRQEAKDKYK